MPGVQNGFLPDYVLTPVTPTCRAENHVAPDLTRLLNAAAAAGVRLTAEECYRDYAGQVYWRNYYCSIGACQLAAVPGTSMHGWGKAIDFGDGTDNFSFSSPAYRWLKANAARYNINHPGWAEPGSDSSEPWHWEWVGDGGTLFGRIYHATASAGEVARNADGRLEVFGVGPDNAGAPPVAAVRLAQRLVGRRRPGRLVRRRQPAGDRQRRRPAGDLRHRHRQPHVPRLAGGTQQRVVGVLPARRPAGHRAGRRPQRRRSPRAVLGRLPPARCGTPGRSPPTPGGRRRPCSGPGSPGRRAWLPPTTAG